MKEAAQEMKVDTRSDEGVEGGSRGDERLRTARTLPSEGPAPAIGLHFGLLRLSWVLRLFCIWAWWRQEDSAVITTTQSMLLRRNRSRQARVTE